MGFTPVPASTPTPPALVVRGLSKAYGPVAAVSSLDLTIGPGEVVGLLGPNGAGKTTSLECIVGLRVPDSGGISIAGSDARTHPEEAKRKVGAQLQAAGLQDPLTPRQALRFFGSFYPDALAPEELIRRFGLEEKADARFETLSAGQRQRLFLAMAFVHRPPLVVLDEPTTGLDPHARRELHALIQGLSREGTAVLLSTHDLAEAEQVCTRICILDGGRLVAEGPPDEIAGRSSGVILVVRLRQAVAVERLRQIAGVRAVEAAGERWSLRVANLNGGLAALTAWVQATGNEIVDLEIQRPSLEEAFVSLTRNPGEGRTR